MLHKLSWFHDLNIEYDTSTFDTDPFEPNPCGARTIFPFIVTSGETKNQYVEMPYTLPQDFTLFILMRHRNIDVWRRKLEWVVRHGGVVLVNTHPDYMNMNGQPAGREEYRSSSTSSFCVMFRKNIRGSTGMSFPGSWPGSGGTRRRMPVTMPAPCFRWSLSPTVGEKCSAFKQTTYKENRDHG